MNNLKPIETLYNGYRFRSRLEARWAVFFDCMGINYDYEPEGFDLKGEYYLPDFYLKKADLYVEIKPFNHSIVHHVGDHNIWEQKCALFRDIVERPILICYDEPAKGLSKILFCWDCNDSSAGSSEWKVMFNFDGDILTTPTNRDICVNPCMQTNEHIRPASKYEWELLENTNYSLSDDSQLTWAKIKARQARFEHGEKPNFINRY